MGSLTQFIESDRRVGARRAHAASIIGAVFVWIIGIAQTAGAASFISTSDLGVDLARTVIFAGVSGDGRVAFGHEWVGGETGAKAIAWSAEQGFLNMGLLPPEGFECQSRAASFDGSRIVGDCYTPVDSDDPDVDSPIIVRRGFLWDPVSGMQDLEGIRSIVEPTVGNGALGISADGRTIVGTRLVAQVDVDDDVRNFWEATIWQEGLGPRLLGTLEPDPEHYFFPDHGSFAHDVSADGRIVVGVSNTRSGREAFVWDDVRGMRGLGRLPSDAASHSVANGISGDGSTIIGMNFFYGRQREEYSEGFVYTEERGLQGMSRPGERWAWMSASDVSYDGSRVVGSRKADGAQWEASEAFVWDPDLGVRPLKDLLAAYGLHLPGWRLTDAWGVSDDGRTIVGAGIDPGGIFRSFIAVIPEPGVPLLLGLGLAGLGGMRPRKRAAEAVGDETARPTSAGSSTGSRPAKAIEFCCPPQAASGGSDG